MAGGNDTRNIRVREVRTDRKAEMSPSGGLGNGKRSFWKTEVLKGARTVRRNRVVHQRVNLVRGEVLLQAVAQGMIDDV